MREKYLTPEMEITIFSNSDIITSSIENETPFVPFSETWAEDIPSVN